MSRQIVRRFVHYYVALRLSAGAATASWPFDQPRDPDPIVRVAPSQVAGGFDPRESFTGPDGALGVITLPQRHARDAGILPRAFSLN